MPNYLLLKRKKAKNWEVVIPLKKGVTKTQASKALKGGVRPGYQASLVSEKQLKNLLTKIGGSISRSGSKKKTKVSSRRRKTKTRSKKRKTRRKK